MITSLPKRNAAPRDLSLPAVRANANATRAANRTPCDRCGKPATMFVSVPSISLHSHRCYWCSCDVSQWAHQNRAEITVQKLSTVIAIREIDGVLLADYCREVLDGVVGQVPLVVMASFAGARDAVVVTLESRVRRPLTETELSAVTIAVSTEMTRRDRQKRAQLRETQERLASPFSAFARRIG